MGGAVAAVAAVTGRGPRSAALSLVTLTPTNASFDSPRETGLGEGDRECASKRQGRHDRSRHKGGSHQLKCFVVGRILHVKVVWLLSVACDAQYLQIRFAVVVPLAVLVVGM